jgi:hypothetical protein
MGNETEIIDVTGCSRDLWDVSGISLYYIRGLVIKFYDLGCPKGINGLLDILETSPMLPG